MKICGECGASNPDVSKFCGECGAALTAAPIAPVPFPAGPLPPTVLPTDANRDIAAGAPDPVARDPGDRLQELRDKQADVLFVLDCTHSMQGEIDGIKDAMTDFADSIQRDGVRVRVGLVEFRDRLMEEEQRVLTFDGEVFTSDPQAFRQEVSKLKASGGGDLPESSLDALVLATQQPFDRQANRTIVLVTDAPPHIPDKETQSIEDAVAALRAAGIDRLYLVMRTRERASQVYLQLFEGARGLAFELGKGGDFQKRAEDFKQTLMSLGKTISQVTRCGNFDRRSAESSLADWQPVTPFTNRTPHVAVNTETEFPSSIPAPPANDLGQGIAAVARPKNVPPPLRQSQVRQQQQPAPKWRSRPASTPNPEYPRRVPEKEALALVKDMRNATGAAYAVGILGTFFGVVASALSSANASLPISGSDAIIGGLLYLGLGFGISKRSLAVAVITFGLYILDSIYILYLMVENGRNVVGGVPIRIAVIVFLYKGIIAIQKWKKIHPSERRAIDRDWKNGKRP